MKVRLVSSGRIGVQNKAVLIGQKSRANPQFRGFRLGPISSKPMADSYGAYRAYMCILYRLYVCSM
jgi:hypothetical protein